MGFTMDSFNIKLLLLGCFFCLAAPLVSSKHVICYQGQSYWCKNITTAAECNAVKHCIHSVWEQEVPIEADKSSVCQTCMDMVKLARDQLQSNETEEELKQVLEGTCLIIPEKHLRRDCDKLMDDFGSYLVDSLSSQMDPSVVCSVAGLCYNDKFKNVKPVPELNCDNCNGLMKMVEGKIETASTADIEDALKNLCRNLGTFSDVCYSLIAEHMESMDAVVRNNVRAASVCDLAGVCAEKFHSHSRKSDIPVPSDVQVFNPSSVNDDLPCELCEQLVKHLRDVLIANTTEDEFKMVLDGLCKMSKFKNECDSFIDQYYAAVYDFLVNELDGKVLCAQIKICTPTSKTLVTPAPVQIAPLPLERMKLTFMPEALVGQQNTNTELCAFCEYLLHYVQEKMTYPTSEKIITSLVEGVCTALPGSVRKVCETFVETYMPQFIALLANGMDPSQVCPAVRVCPSKLVAVEYKDKPTCPLCLLAMEEALKKVQNRSESAIGDVLDDLCMRDEFPTPVLLECVKFVTDYKGPVTDMIIADFTSLEACVYVDLCAPPADSIIPPPKTMPSFTAHAGDVATNEINEFGNPNACVLCEFVMEKLAKMIKDKKTEEEIKQEIMHVCNYVPRTVTDQCKQFVAQYADLVLDLLVQEVSPKLVCSELNLCVNHEFQIMNPVKRCVVCEVFMDSLKAVITNEEIDADMNAKMMKACRHFPSHDAEFCVSMVQQLGPQIEAILRSVPVGPLVCRRLNLCARDRATEQLHLLGMDVGPGCYSGPEYWCATSANAVECDKIDYCQTNVWRSEKPIKRRLKGTDVI